MLLISVAYFTLNNKNYLTVTLCTLIETDYVISVNESTTTVV